jgi:hypothetical protein
MRFYCVLDISGVHAADKMGIPTNMTGKSKPEIKLGATVRLSVHSGEIVEGRVVYLWRKIRADGPSCI